MKRAPPNIVHIHLCVVALIQSDENLTLRAENELMIVPWPTLSFSALGDGRTERQRVKICAT